MIGSGTVIARRYRLERLLAEGGMGAVWAARHLALDTLVAVKLISSTDPTGEHRRRFDREARSAARVRHRNIVEVLDFGEEDGVPFLVMALLEGESLASRLAHPPAPTLGDIVGWIDQCLAGLSAIHAAGVVHRDLKPANVFCARDADGEIIKLVDFGIARPIDDAGLTTAHAVGTPAFMAPEQLTSPRDVDGRADLWAVGVILYEALAGRRPFIGETPYEVVGAILSRRPPPRLVGVPDAIAAVVMRALEHDLDKRYPDAPTMRRALQEATGRSPTSSQPLLAASSVDAVPTERAVARTRVESAGDLPDGFQLQPPSSSAPRFLIGGGLASVGLLLVLSLCCLVDRAWIERPPPPPATEATTFAAVPGDAGPPPSAIVAGPASAADLLVAWRHLSQSDRDLVRFAGEGGSLVALSTGSDAAHAAALFGGHPSGLRPAGATLAPRIARAGNRLRVLSDPTGDDVVGVVPAGTALVVLEGEIAGYESQVDRDDGRVRVAVSTTLDGWVSATEIDPWTSCVPSVDALDGGRRAFVDTTGPPARTRDPMFLFFELGDPGWVSIASRDASCQVDTIATAPTGQPIAEVFLTRTALDTGSVIAMIGRWTGTGGQADARISWSASTIIPTEHRFNPVWEIELYSGHALPEAQRDAIVGPLTTRPGRGAGFWPLRVRQAGQMTYYVWREAGFLSREGFAPEP